MFLSSPASVVELVISIIRLCIVMMLVPIAEFLFNYILMVVTFKGARFRVYTTFFVTLKDMIAFYFLFEPVASGGFNHLEILVSFWWPASIIINLFNHADLNWKY